MDTKTIPLDAVVAGELVALFDKAESHIKNLELLYEEGLYYHPVNQLRYAGYHIARAIEASEGDKEQECKRAKSHCQRAVYDASEMAIVYCIAEINGFQKDYKNVEIPSTVGDYLDILRITREAQDLIKTTDHDTREEKYKECDEYYELLKPHVDRLNDARPELNKRMNEQRRNLLIGIGGLILVGLGIAVTIVMAPVSS